MKRVLIIEDETLLRDAYELVLKAQGYTVAVAENGKVGLAKLRSFKPDLILLDMLMPVMDGQQFLKAAELPSKYPTIKVVIVSNLSDPLRLKDAKRFGVAESVVKASFSPADLVSLTKKHLQ